LLGFEERTVDVQLREIKEQLSGMDSRIANYFMATLRAIADEGKNGPRLFTFLERDDGVSLKHLFSRPLAIRLWCEAEGCQHPLIGSDRGFFPIDQPQEWVINTAFGDKTTEKWGIDRQLSMANTILGKLPAKLEMPDRALAPGQMLSEPERSGILALHQFLDKVDHDQARLGLHRVPTYTGDYRWLCDYHYKAWQPNIPDVIPAHG
jgi:hypothetical protein